MNTTPALRGLLVCGLVFLAGCTTRSISNSGYDARDNAGPLGSYRGELSEFEVIGLTPNSAATDDEIRAALAQATRPQLSRNNRVLLVQSGADFPDYPMISALRHDLFVEPFSGKPPAKSLPGDTYARSLRLAAARGGFDRIVCYWGILESEHENKATKTISWVPIIGNMLPDERQAMRIRLKAAIIDVATGQWSLVTPPAVSSSKLSSIVTRRNSDQELVTELKEAGYRELSRTLLPTG